jgi:hypothetical protein
MGVSGEVVEEKALIKKVIDMQCNEGNKCRDKSDDGCCKGNTDIDKGDDGLYEYSFYDFLHDMEQEGAEEELMIKKVRFLKDPSVLIYECLPEARLAKLPARRGKALLHRKRGK